MASLVPRSRNVVAAACVLLLLAGVSPAAAKKATSQRSTAHRQAGKASAKSKKARQGWRTRQAAPDGARVREIQTALIRDHYLDGEPSGKWDAPTKSALQKLQAENGWQTKRIPDSRALIKLGLGPDRAKLMNPDTASLAPSEIVTRGGNQ